MAPAPSTLVHWSLVAASCVAIASRNANAQCTDAELAAAAKPHHIVGRVRVVDCHVERCTDGDGWLSASVVHALDATPSEHDYIPLLLKGTHVSSWKAVVDGWTPATLSKIAPSFEFDVKTGSKAEKYFSDDPEEPICSDPAVADSCVVDGLRKMSYAAFVKRASQGERVYSHVRCARILSLPKCPLAVRVAGSRSRRPCRIRTTESECSLRHSGQGTLAFPCRSGYLCRSGAGASVRTSRRHRGRVLASAVCQRHAQASPVPAQMWQG
jgi:hypothetical protein